MLLIPKYAPEFASFFALRTVYDAQGRRRFHGAWTGGYSAGYYNTVGSAEGWAPSAYVSSRDRSAKGDGQRRAQTVADFQDEEDGVLGGRISMAGGFGSDHLPEDGNKISRPSPPALSEVHSSLIETFVQARIGKRLLQSLGLREGSSKKGGTLILL